MNNIKKKRKIVILIVLIIALIYFVPRLLLITGMKVLHHCEFEEIKEIELSEKQNLSSDEIEYKRITISIPIHDKKFEKFKVKEYDGLRLSVDGYGYIFTFYLNNGENYFINDPIDSDMREHYLNAKTHYEYKIKCLDIAKKDLSIFQPISSLKNNYFHYRMKDMLIGFEGSTFARLQKHGYFYVIALNDIPNDKQKYNTMTISIYDEQNDYNYLGRVHFLNFNGMNLDDVSFIAKSIRIDREEE